MSELIDRQQALDIFDDYNVSVENGELEAYSRDRKRMCELPPVQPEPTDINAKEAVYNLAEKIGIHQLFALTVELRGEPIQPEPQWIPVSERLPETEEFVLASLTGKYRNITFEHACEIADYADGEWCVYAYPHMSAEKCAELIEAWMPLPTPYKPNNK